MINFRYKPVNNDLRLSLVKSLGTKWMVVFHYYLKSKPEIVSKAAGINIDSWIETHC